MHSRDCSVILRLSRQNLSPSPAGRGELPTRACDNEIIEVLAKRMRVCREIGTFKKEHDMTILQTGRYNEILDKRGAQGSLCGMDSEFIKKVFEAIHEESVRQQMEIINK